VAVERAPVGTLLKVPLGKRDLPPALAHDDGFHRADCFADCTVDARVRGENDLGVAANRQAVGRTDVHAVSAQRAEARVDVRQLLARHILVKSLRICEFQTTGHELPKSDAKTAARRPEARSSIAH
jgi:hypothetical protein